MNFLIQSLSKKILLASFASTLILVSCDRSNDDKLTEVATNSNSFCPTFGWSEGLGVHLGKDAKMSVNTPVESTDCRMNEWSWEAFVWATAIVNGQPRFMSWKTDDDLVTGNESPSGVFRLDAHMKPIGDSENPHMQDTAFVEADGSMLVGLNGFPVYASMHMTDGYFDTVQRNLIATGAYEDKLGSDDYFAVGDAVVKATWYRLDSDETAPKGSYTTTAEIPNLKKQCSSNDSNQSCSVVGDGTYTEVTVALVGMHVVGYTENHPEFIWGTFEHNKNSPQIKDGTFDFDSSDSNPENYTFYQAGTSYSKDDVLVPTQPAEGEPAVVSFDETTQKFLPLTQVVLMNKTGGENQKDGPQNIENINGQSQNFMRTQSGDQALFANYDLIGTVWFDPNKYEKSNPDWKTMSAADAVGSILLANTTAETFFQVPAGGNTQNCFTCHTAGSFSYIGIKPSALPERRVAISHMIATGSEWAVPNTLPVKDETAGE